MANLIHRLHDVPTPYWATTRQMSVFNCFTQAEAEMFRKFTHLMFS
jgi:hypothetical protein